MLSPAALSIITTVYTGRQRAAALGAWGAIGGGGAAAGLFLGGALTSLAGWPWVFFINVPVGIVAILMTVRLVPSLSPPIEDDSGIDITGALAIVAIPVLLVLAITAAPANGVASGQVLVPLALAVMLFGAFVQIERSVRRPLIPPTVWHVRSLLSSAVVMLGATGILVGALFLNSIFLQRVLGASAFSAGLAFLPFAVTVALAAHLGGHLLSHLGTRIMAVVGLLIAAGGILLMGPASAHATYATDLLPGLVALGVGLGFVFLSVSVAAMADVDEPTAGVAAGLMITSHEIGAALSVAVLSGIATAAVNRPTLGLVVAYRAGFTSTAIFAAALAFLALVVMPSVRPTRGMGASIH